MNGEIKFKVWDKELNQYVSPNVHHLVKDGEIVSVVLDFHINKIAGGDRFIIQRFSGLKDKNKTEIYEGDIVKIGYGENIGALGKVTFKCGAFMLTSKHGYNFQDTYKSCLYGEVIGNIFENKDLL